MNDDTAGTAVPEVERCLEGLDLLLGDVWATAPGASEYLVGSQGQVVSFVGSTPRKLTPIEVGEYEGLQLRHDDGESRKRYLHRLVLHAFVGPPPEGHETRHLDGNPENNALENLAWGSRRRNHRDKHRHGTAPVGEKNPVAKLTADDVREMRRLYATGNHTQKEIADRFGVSVMTANRAIRGVSWSHVE